MAQLERVQPYTTQDVNSEQFSITNKQWLMSADNTLTGTTTESSSEYQSYIPNFDNQLYVGLMQKFRDLNMPNEHEMKIAENPNKFYKTKARNLEQNGPKDKDVNIEKILFGENDDSQTTLMIKNVPIKFSQQNLLDIVNKKFENKFNYFYLPKDMRTQKGVGFAFINLIHPAYIIEFYLDFNCIKWSEYIENCNSTKYCEISYSNVQGIQEIKMELEDKYAMRK